MDIVCSNIYSHLNMPRRNDRQRSRKRPNSGRGSSDIERRYKRPLAHESSDQFFEPKLNEQQLNDVSTLLAGIGVPDQRPFKPDDFQLEAIAAIETEDVLVTAPTGSGKTWIAREEIRRLLASGKRAWYTTPLKALTNSKYAEFSEEFGADKVGILTGDRKENYGAPLIVGTTEIYRNQVFDAMRTGESIDADLVILDEAHYLSDDERGHVWEESIILTPPRIRMLLLSATVGRADVFASWISQVRGTKVRVIDRGGSRPVELRAGYLSSNAQLYPLIKDGRLNPTVEKFTQRRQPDTFRRRR